ncbi:MULTISPECIES: tetratricopeptide repeat protein [unclassified Pseudoalteromonas]|uniref:tetratricopeptide repeat protein n=1 Tax=unclassified Pseudoalteromonas TaxID=194690 RepID=UPI000CF6A8C5|nr:MULTISPECIES: tetratricopeptide repeat protein [unclassified Pseudoalteromonas]
MRFKLVLLLFLLLGTGLWLSTSVQGNDGTEQNSVAQLEAQLPQAKGADKSLILTELVEAYRDNNPPRSLDYAEQALAIFAKYPNAKRQITVLNNMAWAHITLGQYEQAQARTDQSQALSKEADYKRGLYVSVTMQGIIYWRTANYQSALKNFEQALEIAEEQKDTRGIANTTNYIAIIHQTLGEPKKALEYFQSAFELQQQIGEEKSIAVSLNNLANIHGTSGNYSLALDYQLKSLTIRERINDVPGLAQVLGNIGLTYFYLEDYDMALSYLQRALGYYETLQDKLGIAEMLTNLGAVHQRKHQFDAALHQYQSALELAQELDDVAMMARIKIDIASAYIELGDAGLAQEYAEPALQKIIDLKIIPLQANALLVSAKTARLKGEITQAIHLTNRSIEVATDVEDKRMVRDAYQYLYQIYKDKNELAEALHYLELFKQVNDEMFNSESDQRVAFLLSHFEAEKREQQIKLLQADQSLKRSEIEQQRYTRNVWIASLCASFAFILLFVKRMHQNKINRSLNENIKSQRELIQAVAHEFRAPLARVQLAFDMLEDSLNGDNGKLLTTKINNGLTELEKLVKEALDFIQLENKSRALHTSEIKLGNLLSRQLESHVDLYADIHFELTEKGPQPCVVQADSHQLNRAVSNIIRNAARFAETQVHVTLNNLAHHYEICIEDDGPGIPVAERQRVIEPFVRLDLSRCRDSGGVGLGLALAKKISEAHGGKLIVGSSSLGGAKLTIRCPKKPPTINNA